jgi:hypothetical protein
MELTMKKPIAVRAVKRANVIRIAIKPKKGGWKGITLDFTKGREEGGLVYRHLKTNEVDGFFLELQGFYVGGDDI